MTGSCSALCGSRRFCAETPSCLFVLFPTACYPHTTPMPLCFHTPPAQVGSVSLSSSCLHSVSLLMDRQSCQGAHTHQSPAKLCGRLSISASLPFVYLPQFPTPIATWASRREGRTKTIDSHQHSFRYHHYSQAHIHLLLPYPPHYIPFTALCTRRSQSIIPQAPTSSLASPHRINAARSTETQQCLQTL